MEDRKLLYSLMEGVLIIYNEHNNQSKHHLLHAENPLADPILLSPWRLMVLMMSVWFLTVLTWLALTLHTYKASSPPLPAADGTDQGGIQPAPRMQRRNPQAPNYHTHFHCNCGGQRQHHESPLMQHLDDDDLFRELNNNSEEGGHEAMFEVHEAPRRGSLDSHSDDLDNMQVASSPYGAGATYEIAV